MTKINKIVMKGFKSFAKHTELMFGGDFNIVLGPNGAGKSNVLDALCFVLGKTSSKSLRAEKSANLIYNGGKSKKQAKHGEVSIYFDNSNKRFPTKDNEVKATRIVRQNGQSIYKINDKQRTRQQIVDLLSVAKINPDSYNIIMQGDIVRFVEMPPVERRMLIEEIAGISVYEEKKNKALRELEKVDEKLKEADIILTERNTYLKELEKDRNQALKFRDMDDSLKQNKASLLKLQIDKKEEEKREEQKKIDEGNEKLAKINGKITLLKNENEERKKQIEDITHEIEEKGEIEQVKLNKEIETLKIDLTKKSLRIETCGNEINKINKRKQDLKNNLIEIEKKIEGLNKEKEELRKRRAAQSKEKETINNKIKLFKEKNKLEDVGDFEKSIEDIDKKSEELQKKIHGLREQQHNLIREKDRLQHQINTADERIKKVKQVEKEYKTQIDELKNKREEFKRSTLELNKLLNEDSSLALQIDNSRKKLQNANEELAKLKARDISIKEFRYSNIAIKKVLEQKNKIRGIYGTVAELGNVNAKYSLALEVAAGPRMKSIVVEDDKVAAGSIKYLKDNKLGVVTFLPLNKIKAKSTKPETSKLAKSKGCHGLAIDLISFDGKFKKIFSHVFSDTIVVDNIDVARRLGIGKARMVTLDGDLTELSGVMQGGYRKKRQGLGFKEKEIIKDIEEYKELTANLENTLSTLEKRRKENEEKITKLREKKAHLDGDIIKTEKSLHLEAGDIEVSKQQKEELNKDASRIEDEINALQSKIKAYTEELTAIKTEKQKLRSRISELKDPALIAELTTFEEKIRELNENITQLDLNIRNIGMQIDTVHSPEKEKTEQILKQSDKETIDFKKELDELTKLIKDHDAVLKEKEETAKEFYKKFKDLFSKRTKINEEIQNNENILNSRQEESKAVEIKNNTFSLKNAELSAVLAGLNREFQQYEGVKLDLSRNEQQLKTEISRYEKLKEEIGTVNMRALEIYEEVKKEYNNLLEKKEKLSKEKEDVFEMMKEIESKKKDLFMRTFDVTNENFGKIFQRLSTKGTAHMELENPENPFEGGLLIKVKITGNKFLDIRSLSGGEKTLTALAFIFSIQEHEPASFYVLDEVDAALDKHNSEKFAKLIKKYSEKAQYILVSHNDSVISEASTLYGVSMDEHNISKVVSLKI